MATHVAREPFSFTSKDGMPRVFTPGQTIDTGDPDFKGREHLFEPAEDRTARDSDSRASRTTARASETATAAPGEIRTRTVPPHPAAPKPAPPQHK
jgi:hypothetical protein